MAKHNPHQRDQGTDGQPGANAAHPLDHAPGAVLPLLTLLLKTLLLLLTLLLAFLG